MATLIFRRISRITGSGSHCLLGYSNLLSVGRKNATSLVPIQNEMKRFLLPSLLSSSFSSLSIDDQNNQNSSQNSPNNNSPNNNGKNGRTRGHWTGFRPLRVKPGVVRKRLSVLRTYVGQETAIRHSPWRLNLVCRLAAGLPVEEALVQLQFCSKRVAPTVARVVQRTANLASVRDGLPYSQLEVAECFATPGTPLPRVKIMGRGRAGKKHRRFAHVRLVIREIDFDLKIVQSKSHDERRKWLMMKDYAEQEKKKALEEEMEVQELERAVAEKKKEREAKEANKK